MRARGAREKFVSVIMRTDLSEDRGHCEVAVGQSYCRYYKSELGGQYPSMRDKQTRMTLHI